jgi:two-component system LytT family response regulator
MNVLILDQNPEDALHAKSLCREICDHVNNIDLVKSFDVMKTLFLTNTYDVLILNIDTDPEATEQLLEDGPDGRTSIVLTSKENILMIKALNHSISGYLSKPITLEQFSDTLSRVKKKHEMRKEMMEREYGHFKNLIKEGQINRIALITLDGYVIVHYDDIIRCEANGNYTSVYFSDGSFLMLTKTLKHYDSRLGQHGFFRIHKTHLVNLKFIRSYVKGKSSYVELKDGTHIEVSSRKKQNLVEIMNK